MLFYSHMWDLILKLTSLFAVIVLAVRLHSEETLRSVGVPNDLAVPTLIAALVVVWVVLYRQVLSTIAAWLYARVNLGAHVSLREARQLVRLFQLDLSLKWVPLKEIKRMPKAERRRALLVALETLGPRRKAVLF